MDERDRKVKVISLAILMSFFYLNDFLYMPVHNYREWLFVDYAVRIAAVAVILYLIKKNTATPADFGLVKLDLKQGVSWSVLASAAGVLVDQLGAGLLEKLSSSLKPATFPVIKNLSLKVVDLTAGIALVSVTEELIFRAFFYTVMKRFIPKPVAMIMISSLLFGLMHWSQGLNIIIVATLWAIVPMYVMVRTGSVVPALIAHYVTDFAAFV